MATHPHKSLTANVAAALPLGIFLTILLLQAFKGAPFPQDDLLRDVVAYAWQFDYRKLYAFSPQLPTFDPYLAFDWILGVIARLTSPAVAAASAQLAETLAYATVLLAPMARTEDRAFKGTATLFLVLGSMATSRLVDGRPEVVATIWLLSAATLRPRVWLALGALLAPAYWLMPIYAVGGLLLPATWKQRLLSVGTAVALSVSFWLAYGQADWIHHVLEIPRMAAHRTMVAPEAAPLGELWKHPGTWLLAAAMLGAIAVHRTKLRRPEWLIVTVVFLAIGSVRHIVVLAPLVTTWIILQPWKAPRLGGWCTLVILAIIAGILAMMQLSSGERVPDFNLRTGSVVLAGYNQGVFSLPFYNPGKITLAPSIESAWDGPKTSALALAVVHGTLTCDQLAGEPFTHVLSTSKVRLRGRCFSLETEKAGWRLWNVGAG